MSDKDLLKRFMQEHFPYSEFKKIGYFTKEMRGDYEAQAKRVCKHFGYETVFEYGAKEIRCHITYANPDCPIGIDTFRPLHIDENGELKPEPFITIIPSIYE
jgi:hypothetical protein